MGSLPTGFFPRILFELQHYGMSFIGGAGTTLIIAVVSTAIGCVIGFLCGIVQTIPVAKSDNVIKKVLLWIARLILNIYVEVFRGTPMMAQAVFIFYGSAYLFDINMSRWFAAIFIVSINTGAYMAETVRGGILSIDPGQTEGAKAIGMTHFQTMMGVILPQALRNLMPQIGNNLIINIKDTCVLSVISIVELFFVYKSVSGTYYTMFESITIAMIIYLCMTLFFSRLLRWIESKMDGDDSFNLATQDTLAHTSGMTRYRAVKNAELTKSRKKAGVSDIGNLNLDQNERGR